MTVATTRNRLLCVREVCEPMRGERLAVSLALSAAEIVERIEHLLLRIALPWVGVDASRAHDDSHTGLKSFPVVDGDRLVGMMPRGDILRALRCAAADG